MNNEPITYNLGEGVEAFSTRRECQLPYPVITGHQVHGTEIAFIEKPGLSREDLEGFDAFITSCRDCAIAVRTADCIPVLLYDPVKKVIAAVHSGWKGTVQRIPVKCITQMSIKYGCSPADIKAAIGPGIGIDSFQVGEEVVNFFREAGFPIDEIYRWDGPKTGMAMKGGHHLDLFKANSLILKEAGVLPENIQICGIDTYADESFFSARREGYNCGRILNVIKLI